MNNRDPFAIRRSQPALQLLNSKSSSPATAAQRPGQRIVDKLRTTVEDFSGIGMAALPNSASHRHSGSGSWTSTDRSRDSNLGPANGSSVGGRFGSMFGEKETLPMYKDKPYSYSASRRGRAWYKSRRLVGLTLCAFLSTLWWLEVFSSSSDTAERSTASTSSWFTSGKGKVDWIARADHVREVFQQSYSDYEKHGWGYDEYKPKSKTHRQMVDKGMGWIIVDALDTMMIMNLSTELKHAREWVHSSLSYDKDHDVNTFETTIRMLGGLLSAHYLSTQFPGKYAPVSDGLSDDLYIEKATDLAERLTGAYKSRSGIPYASVNLHKMEGIVSHDMSGASSTAEAATLQLEMKYLSKLTGETMYWELAEKVMEVMDAQHPEDGLVPIYIDAETGHFSGHNIRLGSRGDSYYEYLIKQYLQTSQQEPVYEALWNESLAGVKKHLITYSSPSNFTVLAERQAGLDNPLTAKMDHLVCFMPGTIALATTKGLTVQEARKKTNWGAKQEEDMRLAEELMRTCWGMYIVTPTGLAGEITYFKTHDPPLMYNDFAVDKLPQSPKDLVGPLKPKEGESEVVGFPDFEIHPMDGHNLQRPETVESLFYMWRITGNLKYREWGWKMFESFIMHTKIDDGPAYSSISDVKVIPTVTRDNMESFWLAETLKYFFLLFSNDDILPLTDVVFNTEAHPFPKFELGKLFKTGWERKPRTRHVEEHHDASKAHGDAKGEANGHSHS